MKQLFYLIFAYLLLFSIEILAQQQWGVYQPDYRRDLYKYGSQAVGSHGLSLPNTQFFIGTFGDPAVYRAVYQWDILDTEIPDNSTINFVRLTFDYSKNGHSYELLANFYKITNNIIPGTGLDQIFAEMDYTIQEIAYCLGDGNQIVFESANPDAPFNQAIKSMLTQNKFVLGIKWSIDHSQYIRSWLINNYAIELYIEYSPPTETVTVDQKLSNNSSIDSIGLWDLELVRFHKYSVPKNFTWEVNEEPVLRGTQKIISNEKYIQWKENSEVIINVENHKKIKILPTTSSLTSNFFPTHSGVTIKNNLSLSNTNGGIVGFKDPWFIDYQDASYGNNLRNRGMYLALWRNRPSPFYPNYTTVFNNGSDPSQSYKGVFLNQTPDPNDPNIPYYSVKAISPQDIPLTQTGKTHKFYFQDWTGSGVQFKYTTAQETPVVFTSGNATVNANLKGHLLSDASLAFSGNGQRKLVRDS